MYIIPLNCKKKGTNSKAHGGKKGKYGLEKSHAHILKIKMVK